MLEVKEPPKISNSTFGSLPPLLHDSTLLDKVGLDAVASLRSFHTLRCMITALAVVSYGARECGLQYATCRQ